MPSPSSNSEPCIHSHGTPTETRAYWDAFYNTKDAPEAPSSFARWVLPWIDRSRFLIDIGCGNGRDTMFFLSAGCPVVAMDQSAEAIGSLGARLQRPGATDPGQCRLMVGDMAQLRQVMTGEPIQRVGTVYTRFSLHAVDEHTGSAMLSNAYRLLDDDGLILIEARSVHSSLYGKGTPAGTDAFIHGHYRRFIRLPRLQEELQDLGFVVEIAEEKGGVAIHGDDDPVVVRVVARKRNTSKMDRIH
eukprot:gb/GECH01007937.1/.p1 GENE.gb/GECH01007937.1/~~gb/GECH01007937.1/.p1  ORF type:complete len:245 (+),score=39.56 gb/GECH01007937.1/:1-735(+)